MIDASLVQYAQSHDFPFNSQKKMITQAAPADIYRFGFYTVFRNNVPKFGCAA
jgi:hypothetical protein